MLLASIGQAINAGAIILLPDNDTEIAGTSIRGKRMRLAYIFAPYYCTLLRLGWAISLETIIDRASPPNNTMQQSSLPFEEDLN